MMMTGMVAAIVFWGVTTTMALLLLLLLWLVLLLEIMCWQIFDSHQRQENVLMLVLLMRLLL